MVVKHINDERHFVPWFYHDYTLDWRTPAGTPPGSLASAAAHACALECCETSVAMLVLPPTTPSCSLTAAEVVAVVETGGSL